MKRQQIVDRLKFDYYDRVDVLEKTGYKCAHCGKPLTTGAEMEVDHFVPISKGGFNQKLNLFPLCNECNERKNNKVVSPDWYLKYVKESDKKQVSEYFDSFSKSFDYLSRGNLFLCDIYEAKVYMGPRLGKKKLSRQVMEKMSKPVLMEKVCRDELPEAKKLLVRYLEKYNRLDSREAVRKNLEFWFRFGCIYCIRDAALDEMRILMPVTVKTDPETGEKTLCVYMFSLYATDLSLSIASQLPSYLARKLMKEQALPSLKVEFFVLGQDPLSGYMKMDRCLGLSFARLGLGFGDKNAVAGPGHPFYDKMKDVRYYMDKFFSRPGYSEIEWMGNDVIMGYEMRHVEPEPVQGAEMSHGSFRAAGRQRCAG